MKSNLPQYSRLVIPLINSILRINKYEIIKWEFYEDNQCSCSIYGNDGEDTVFIEYNDLTKMKGILDTVSELLHQIGVKADLAVSIEHTKDKDNKLRYCFPCFNIWFTEL